MNLSLLVFFFWFKYKTKSIHQMQNDLMHLKLYFFYQRVANLFRVFFLLFLLSICALNSKCDARQMDSTTSNIHSNDMQ